MWKNFTHLINNHQASSLKKIGLLSLDKLSTFLLEKGMAPHSSALAWKISWMEEPGRLQSMGSLGVGHD